MFIRNFMIVLVGFLGLCFFSVVCAAPHAVQHRRPAVVAQSNNAIVNINRADAATLEGVKGIGPKRAQAIVAYREQHGPFKSVQDLSKIRGVGGKNLSKVERHLSV